MVGFRCCLPGVVLGGFAPLAECEKSVPPAASSVFFGVWGWDLLPFGSPEAAGLLPGGLHNARATAPRRLFQLLVLFLCSTIIATVISASITRQLSRKTMHFRLGPCLAPGTFPGTLSFSARSDLGIPGPSRNPYPFRLGLRGFAPLAEREKSVPPAASPAAILDRDWGSRPCGSPEAAGLLPGGLQNARPTAPHRLFRLLVLSCVPSSPTYTTFAR